MVKYIRNEIMGCLIVFSVIQPIGAQNNNSTFEQRHLKVIEAMQVLQTKVSAEVRKSAINELVESANMGDDEAMHGLGMVHYLGLDSVSDVNLALKWFLLAAEKGNCKSAYNLSTMYRQGVSVPQDFEKAYKYACIAAEYGMPQAIYTKGYLLYKGLGCNQSYEEALISFKEAAAVDHGYAMYMIGLCYKNGYGVQRDMTEAYYWLKQAADKGIKASSDELIAETAENPLNVVVMKSKSSTELKKQPVLSGNIKHSLQPTQSIEGVYSGTLITYDWSGKQLIKESPLDVSITQTGNEVVARWKEDTLTTVEVHGVLTDSALVFSRAAYFKNDHYTQGKPAKWNFIKANLNSVSTDGQNYLAGELQLYSPDTNEPGKPMYLSLVQKTKSVAQVSLNENYRQPKIYPNPFIDNLTVSFWLDTEAECNITVNTMTGIKVYDQQFGKISAGMHRYQLMMNLITGNYAVKLVYGNKMYETVVIKK